MKRIICISTTLLCCCVLAYAQKAAEIKFNKTSHDFGVFSESSPIVAYTFTYENVGESPLIINQVVSSCGCAVADFSKEPVQPGQQGQIKVTYNGTGKFPGHFKKSITIRTNGATAMTRLYIEGNMEDAKTFAQHSNNATYSSKNNNIAEEKLTIQNNTAQASEIPNLSIIDNSISFYDKDGMNAIQGGKKSVIKFKVKNSGKGVAKSCKVITTTKGTNRDVTIQNFSINSIAAGETKNIEIPITAGLDTQNGEIEFTVQVDEPHGFGTDPQYITVKTYAFEAPMVQITDYSLTSTNGQALKKKQPFDLQLMLQNINHGNADNVSVDVEVPKDVLILDGQQKQQFAMLSGGETQSLVYSLIVNNNYVGTTIPIKIHVKEKYGKYSKDRSINLSLDQSMSSTKIAIDETKPQKRHNITIASIGSDVDKDIPSTSIQQKNTFAVIITNENYTMIEPVPFARNDGNIFSIYCNQTLGIPQQNIRVYQDATYGKLLTAIKDIKNIANAYKGDINVVFYYAGHGVPDEQSHDAYLLPIDSDGKMIETCYSLNKLYKELGSLNAKNVVVFMDACFSGARRGEGMLASARGVAIKANGHTPQGNMIVFSASSGDETAYPFKEQNHGLFTYFLLKKLKESKGDCSLGELGTYIQDNVKQTSIVYNRKSQTPTVVPSTSVSDDWKNLKLK